MDNKRTESLSSLNMFSQCPRRYWEHYLSGQKIDASNDFLERGRKIHQALEAKKSEGLDDEDRKAIEKGYQLLGGKGQKVKGQKLPLLKLDDTFFLEMPEVAFGLTKNQKIVDFWDESAIFRGKIDLVRFFINKQKLQEVSIIDDAIDKVLLVDWKTGEKAKNDRKQLSYYSLYVFFLLPDIQHTECRNILLDKEEQPESFIVSRSQIENLWDEIISKVNRVYAEQEFRTIRSGLCNYCQYQFRCPAFEDDNLEKIIVTKLEGKKVILNPFLDFLEV